MKYFLSLALIISILPYTSIAQCIKGKITDESGAPIPFANVFIQKLSTGTSSNIDGLYNLKLPAGTWQVSFRYIGYQTYSTEVTIGKDDQELNISLKTQHYQIPEIKVLASGEDPAYYIMRRVIAMGPYYQKQVSKYSCKVYVKGNGVFDKIPKIFKKAVAKDGIKENEPTVYETLSKVNFELPDNLKQEILAMRTSGKQSNTNPMPYIVNSLYDAEKYEFVSPVGRNALKTYNFRLAGVFEENGKVINKIELSPKHQSKDVFSGFLYITDQLWNIHSADLTAHVPMTDITFHQVYSEVAKNTWMPVNMDFDMNMSGLGFKMKFKYVASINEYEVTLNPKLDHSFLARQERIINQDQMVLDSIRESEKTAFETTKRQKEIAQILEAENLSNHQAKRLNKLMKEEVKENTPPEPLEIKSKFIYDQKKTRNDSAYWAGIRPVPLTANEMTSFAKKDSFLVVSSRPAYKDSVRNEMRKFKLKHLLSGHTYNYSVDSIELRKQINFQGLLNVSGLSFNTVDGFLLPVSINYFKTDSTGHLWSVSPSLRYAFSRQKLDGGLNFAHVFNGITHSQIVLSAESGTLDFNRLNGLPNESNSFYTLYLEKNLKKYYFSRSLLLQYGQDLANGLNAYVNVGYADSHSETNHTSFKFYNSKERVYSPNIPNAPISLPLLSDDRQEATLRFGLTYTPHNRYYLRKNRKTYAQSQYPTFSLKYKKSIPGIGGSDGDYDFLELGINQKINLGISGQLSYQVNGGGFLNRNKVFFENYRHFNTNNQSLAMNKISSDCFRLLPFYEYSTSHHFVEGHLNFDSRKLLLKQLPFLSDTPLRETLFINALNTNNINSYTEFGYGITNIFLMLNIEAVSSFRKGKYDSSAIKFILNF